MDDIISVAQKQKATLHYYSPYSFLQSLSNSKSFEIDILPELNRLSDSIFPVTIDGHTHYFVYEYLKWDSTYFGMDTIKLKYVLHLHNNIKILNSAINEFIKKALPPKAYCFIEIPSEDTSLIQGLGNNQFKLIETRLTYYNNNIQSFSEPRFPVRLANANDTENLCNVARMMRNKYDRFHADATFSSDIADEFLATYIRESINGFADIVLVPDDVNSPSDSFLTANILNHKWSSLETAVSKMVLSAVSNQTNKGWYKKLISEMTYILRNKGAECIFMNTQSTNRAVLHTWETLGYKLGGTTHILSFNN